MTEDTLFLAARRLVKALQGHEGFLQPEAEQALERLRQQVTKTELRLKREGLLPEEEKK